MQTLDDRQISGLKHFKRLAPLLEQLHDSGTQRDKAHHRQLFFDDYAKLVLLYLFNPLIDSLQMLQQASMLPKVARTLGIKRFSLGSFSEASAVFDPALLQQALGELAQELKPLSSDPRLPDLKHLITLVDATVLPALPKLAQTLYNRTPEGIAIHGWRLHTHLPLNHPLPELLERTGARGNGTCERAHLKQHLRPGRCYVMDRGYHDGAVLNAIHAASSRYVCRARDNVAAEVIEKRSLAPASQQAGILCDQLVQISAHGKAPSDHALRRIEVQAEVHPKRSRKGTIPSSGKVILLTDLLEETPEQIALIYRYRWMKM